MLAPALVGVKVCLLSSIGKGAEKVFEYFWIGQAYPTSASWANTEHHFSKWREIFSLLFAPITIDTIIHFRTKRLYSSSAE